jgi:ABC-type phosphate transport system substrate-binding protein
MRAAILGLLIVLPASAVLGEQAPAAGYVVIVNPRNPAASVDRKFLADAFLKKTRYWPGHEVIHPVDLDPDSPVRRKFAQDVLRRSVPAVKSYWQQLVFSGRDIPPPELDSDEQVVKYVLKFEGAIGYVSATTNLSGVKIVTVD